MSNMSREGQEAIVMQVMQLAGDLVTQEVRRAGLPEADQLEPMAAAAARLAAATVKFAASEAMDIIDAEAQAAAASQAAAAVVVPCPG